jgi:hypothetical protein
MTWMSPVPSRMVAKHSLPPMRDRITRPATPAMSPVAVSGGRPGVRGPDLRDRGGARETDRVGLDAGFEQRVAFAQPDAHLLREVGAGPRAAAR